MSHAGRLVETPVIILCGGKGIFLTEKENKRTNKGLILVNEKPMVYWVMLNYALYGATEFFLAVGFQGEAFNGVLISLGAEVIDYEQRSYSISLAGNECKIWIVASNPEATTGSRLLSCRVALNVLGQRENFSVAYSDTLCDVNLGAQLDFHEKHGRIATVLSAKLPVRFRVLGVRPNEAMVRGFASRPVIESSRVNGGFYLLNTKFWEFTTSLSEHTPLENQPLEELALANQLMAFEHNGFWQTCDSERDLVQLEEIAHNISNMAKLA